VNKASERRTALLRLVESRAVTRAAPPLLLPAASYFDLAGEEFGRQLFITVDNEGREFCIRPDFTLPIAEAYIKGDGFGAPASYTYLGQVYRQGDTGAEELEQAGLELLAQPDAGKALDEVLTFARWALSVYNIDAPRIRLGGVGLFEAFLTAADMTPAWRARIRHRFGHPEAMASLLTRFADPRPVGASEVRQSREALVETVSSQMLAGGLSLGGSRLPEEIADRFLEKQALAAAHIPEATVRLLRFWLDIVGPADAALDELQALIREAGIDLDRAIAGVRQHVAAVLALFPRAEVMFDAAFSPRLDYYTGIVFEMTGEGGSVFVSGGEYDRLLQRLGARTPVAASGCAIFVDRLEAEAAK
jgi:ATP phosphoribosyltransferase regulatory subunit